MSNNFTSNAEIKRITKFISDNWSKLIAFPSFFGIAFLWIYLLSINKVEIFPQMSFASHGILLIALFFVSLFFNFNLPVFIFKALLLENDNFNKFVQDNKVFYILIQPILVLFFLVFRIGYFYFSDDLDCEGEFYLFFLFGIFIFLIVLCFCFFKLSDFFNNWKVVVFYSFLYVLTAIFFVFPLYVIAEMSDGLDKIFFLLIVIYLLFLMASCYVVLYDINLVSYLGALGMIYILLFIALAMVGNGFKLQRMILRPVGIAQTPSQSGGYLLKNGDFLELIERNKFEKYVKTIDARTYTYIHGYLILNVGNVRVICPHDFETESNQRLDFSRCLSLTSEDIKFMKKGFPQSNKNVALMVTKAVMQIEQQVIEKRINSCKKNENSKN